MKNSKGESVYKTIREMAIHYEFRPDENINESALSSELGVSRTPVRDALNKLINEGLVIFKKNHGFFCRSLSSEELYQLAETRKCLEICATRLACENASPESRRALLAFWEDVDRRMNDLSSREIARLDEEFHERIFLMTNNSIMLSMIRQINARIRFIRQVEIENPTRIGADFAMHFRIASSIIDNDMQGAIENLNYHITFTRDDAGKILREGLFKIFNRD